MLVVSPADEAFTLCEVLVRHCHDVTDLQADPPLQARTAPTHPQIDVRHHSPPRYTRPLTRGLTAVPLSSPCLDVQVEKEIQTAKSHILSTMLTATRLLECCCLLDHLITDLTTRTANLTTHILLLAAHTAPPLALQQPRR
jgi:hypothetical protein